MTSAQGHVRVGPETVTNPAFLVTRNMEDFVTWVDTSKIKRKVQKFNQVWPAPPLLALSFHLVVWRRSWLVAPFSA